MHNATWNALKPCVEHLMALRGDLALALQKDHSERAAAMFSSDQSSVSGREQLAKYSSSVASDIIQLRCDIAQYEDLRQLLELAIAHDVELTDIAIEPVR